jgi:choline dehydrogenase
VGEGGFAYGQTWGGSSSVNDMVWAIGSRTDYERWGSLHPRWNWEQSSRAFEDLCSATEWKPGKVVISSSGHEAPILVSIIAAFQRQGIPFCPDYNRGDPTGVAYVKRNCSENRRCSSSALFLRPVLDNANLFVRSSSEVQQICFEGHRAIGVRCTDGTLFTARREIVVCCGGCRHLDGGQFSIARS